MISFNLKSDEQKLSNQRPDYEIKNIATEDKKQ